MRGHNAVPLLAFVIATAATAAAPIPSIFEPGVISAGANDGAPTFAPDGKTLLFERTNSKFTAILESHLVNGHWQRPVLASFSGLSSDQQPSFSPDGRYLIYVSSRPAPGAPKDQRFLSHLYRVDRVRGGWSTPTELPPQVNFSARVFKPSIAANGDLYFMADTGPGGAAKWRLFRASKTPDGYDQAEPLAFSGPDDGDVDPYIAPDQSFIIFSSNSRSELKDGHEHLFMARRQQTGWSAIRPLRYAGDDAGADDGEAQVSPDRRRLFFTSGRVMPVPRLRDHATALAAVARMDSWDNSNSNAWWLPMADYLAR